MVHFVLLGTHDDHLGAFLPESQCGVPALQVFIKVLDQDGDALAFEPHLLTFLLSRISPALALPANNINGRPRMRAPIKKVAVFFIVGFLQLFGCGTG
jgi:hypothetical protein